MTPPFWSGLLQTKPWSVSHPAAQKLLGTGLSASFVFHLAMRNVFLLVHCSPLETFRTVLGSDWGDILNENHERHAFGDERVYDFLDRLTTDHLTK